MVGIAEESLACQKLFEKKFIFFGRRQEADFFRKFPPRRLAFDWQSSGSQVLLPVLIGEADPDLKTSA
jgi:hypothetical protein